MKNKKAHTEFSHLDQGILEEKLGYKFKNPSLLTTALTHSSYSNEMKAKSIDVPYNERLEFLGDSVLSIIVSKHLFNMFPNMPEGDLTPMRASLVCEKTLSKFAKNIELGLYLRLGHGENLGNGRERPSTLADAFEALLAAVYIDSGIDSVRDFLLPLVEAEIEEMQKAGNKKDAKTLLQQIVQQEKGELLEYVVVGESGPDHMKTFDVEARINSNVIGIGSGKTKREAEQNAAREALKYFGEE